MVQPFQITQHINHQRTDRHLRSDIAENACRPESQMFVLPHAGFTVMVLRALLGGNLARIGQPDHFHKYGKDNEQTRQSQIRNLYRGNLFRPVCRLSCIRQNQKRTDLRRNGRTQGIKCLNQGQRCRFLTRFRQQGDIRITGNLQQRNARSQNEQRAQKYRIRMAACRRIKQQAPCRRQQKAADNAVFITDFAHQHTHRDGHHRIGGKETELNQHRLNISQVENLLQMRDKDVVHAGNETHHEKQRGQDDQWGSMIVL